MLLNIFIFWCFELYIYKLEGNELTDRMHTHEHPKFEILSVMGDT